MAFSASSVWEVQASGSDNNAGGFDPGVAGFPTDGTTDSNTGNTASPVFSSASYSFVAGDVGHWVYIKSGTNSLPGWYKIASVSGGKATLNAAIGAAVLAAGTPTTALGIATVGTPTSLTWGIDYSQSTTARIAFTDMVIGGTTTQFTSAANPVGKNFVGNIINVVSGTGFTVQRVAIISTSGTTATCDKSLGTGGSTGGTGNLGGAFASHALPGGVVVAGNSIWIKSGAFSITSASTNVAGGCLTFSVTGVRVEGYGTVRGDIGTAPVLTASGISTATIIATTGDGNFRNITVDAASLTAIRGFNFGGSQAAGYLLTAKNCTNSGFAGNAQLVRCYTTGCSTQPTFKFSHVVNCVAYNNTVTGFQCNLASNNSCVDCVSYNNSGASSDGFDDAGQSSTQFVNCTAYGNGRDGIRSTGAGALSINSIADSNSGTGLNFTGRDAALINCATRSNGTNVVNTGNASTNANAITLTATTFVDAASGNFALNANAGGGALLRAAGIPGVTPDGLSTGYLDVGAIQSKALSFIGVGFEGGFVN